MYEDYQAYFDFMEKLGGILDELTELANRRNAAVRRDDLATVNECMNREQALGLSLRSMDTRRTRLLGKLGMANTRLSNFADHCPLEIRPQARAAAQRLRDRYDIYRSAADAARTTTEMNLHEIEKIIEKRGGDPDGVLPGGRLGTLADIRA